MQAVNSSMIKCKVQLQQYKFAKYSFWGCNSEVCLAFFKISIEKYRTLWVWHSLQYGVRRLCWFISGAFHIFHGVIRRLCSFVSGAFANNWQPPSVQTGWLCWFVLGAFACRSIDVDGWLIQSLSVLIYFRSLCLWQSPTIQLQSGCWIGLI